MAKFHCNVYFLYVFPVEVEADTMEEAYDEAYQMAESAHTEELEYVGYDGGTIAEIVDGKLDYSTLTDMD